MNIIIQISILLLFLGCSNLNKVKENSPLVNLVVKQDKYSLILKQHFYKNFKTNSNNLNIFTVVTNLKFNEKSALSNSGTNNLNLIKGTVDFQIFNKSKTKLISSSSISSSINTGAVSSLYGIDENNNFVKERLSKYLASKLHRNVLLKIRNSEN